MPQPPLPLSTTPLDLRCGYPRRNPRNNPHSSLSHHPVHRLPVSGPEHNHSGIRSRSHSRGGHRQRGAVPASGATTAHPKQELRPSAGVFVPSADDRPPQTIAPPVGDGPGQKQQGCVGVGFLLRVWSLLNASTLSHARMVVQLMQMRHPHRRCPTHRLCCRHS
jgi:hypothetical protein